MDKSHFVGSGRSFQLPDELVGLAPIAKSDAQLLVLGSMPGSRSLIDGQYYAHPQNMFWPIMQSLFGISAGLPYERRVQGLRQSGIALWDVVGRCRRRGSLDQSIDPESVVANDFAMLFERCRDIRKIGFNGRMAEKCWCRYVLPEMPAHIRQIECASLPSTSPAHAAMSRGDKIRAWRGRLRFPPPPAV